MSAGLVALAVVVGVLLVLAVGAVVGDRAVARRAEERAGTALAASFGPAASVRVHGRPFLTQALRGRYAQVEVVGSPRLGEIGAVSMVAHLANVRLPLRDLVGRRVRELPCEHVTGRVVLPFAELARLTRVPGLRLAFDGERLLASAALPIPDVAGLGQGLGALGGLTGLGNLTGNLTAGLAGLGLPGLGNVAGPGGVGGLARVSGEAVLSLRGAGEVWLRVRDVTVAGIVLPDVLLNQLLPALNVPVPLPPLPYGLRLDELRPTASGLVVDGSADAVVFRAGDPVAHPAGPVAPSRPTQRDVRPRP